MDFEELSNALNVFDLEVKLNAIWLKEPIVKNNHEKTRRIASGDLIQIENNNLVDCQPEKNPTHMVLELFGKINNTKFRIIACNMETIEHEEIKL